MTLFKTITSGILASVIAVSAISVSVTADDGMNMFQNSDFIEKEQPELTEETKQLISLYQRNPTEENYRNLRDIVIDNYNAVLDRKEEKLAQTFNTLERIWDQYEVYEKRVNDL